MLLTIFLLLIATALVAVLAFAAISIRRRHAQLVNQKEAARLQRRADHLFKVALATQVHTRQNHIAKTLLQEAIRVLDYSAKLDPSFSETMLLLRECHALLASTEQDNADSTEVRDTILEFPEAELIDAQLHLTEASRLLMGLEKRGLVPYDELTAMLSDLKQAQRALGLRLQLRQAAASASMQRTVELMTETQPGERDKAQSRS